MIFLVRNLPGYRSIGFLTNLTTGQNRSAWSETRFLTVPDQLTYGLTRWQICRFPESSTTTKPSSTIFFRALKKVAFASPSASHSLTNSLVSLSPLTKFLV